MPFTTLRFAGFFGALFLVYYAIPRRFQWWLLLAGSMLFYGYASPYYLLLMWAVILVTHLGAKRIAKIYAERDQYLLLHKSELSREERKRIKTDAQHKSGRVIAIVVVLLVFALGVFKYSQFVLDNIMWLGGALGWKCQSPTLNILLPVGLSFFIFQSMGYCIDVHREEVVAENSLMKHALFVSFFPQIMQGPIGNFGRLAPQLTGGHAFSYDDAVSGLQRVAWGLAKKFLVANTIANRINCVWGAPENYPGFFCWAVFCSLYAIQLYADFSGYMDIACGCSQMLGIKLDENFNCPYLSRSISEFWRRWHMTLGEWFKNYLFYPILRSKLSQRIYGNLQKSRYLANTIPTVLALTVVWFATGLWHGASWGYIAWGCYFGFFMILNVVLGPWYDRFHKAFPRFVSSRLYLVWQTLRTFGLVVAGYAVFKPGDLDVTLQIFKQTSSWRLADSIYQVQHVLHHNFIYVIPWIVVLVVVDLWHYGHPQGSIRALIRRLPGCVRFLFYTTAIVFVLFFGLYTSNYNQFEYFKF